MRAEGIDESAPRVLVRLCRLCCICWTHAPRPTKPLHDAIVAIGTCNVGCTIAHEIGGSALGRKKRSARSTGCVPACRLGLPTAKIYHQAMENNPALLRFYNFGRDGRCGVQQRCRCAPIVSVLTYVCVLQHRCEQK